MHRDEFLDFFGVARDPLDLLAGGALGDGFHRLLLDLAEQKLPQVPPDREGKEGRAALVYKFEPHHHEREEQEAEKEEQKPPVIRPPGGDVIVDDDPLEVGVDDPEQLDEDGRRDGGDERPLIPERKGDDPPEVLALFLAVEADTAPFREDAAAFGADARAALLVRLGEEAGLAVVVEHPPELREGGELRLGADAQLLGLPAPDDAEGAAADELDGGVFLHLRKGAAEGLFSVCKEDERLLGDGADPFGRAASAVQAEIQAVDRLAAQQGQERR